MKRVIRVINSLVVIGVILYFPLGFNTSHENQLTFADKENMMFGQSDPEKIFVNRFAEGDRHLKIIDPWTMKEETILNYDGFSYLKYVTRIDKKSILFGYHGRSQEDKNWVDGLQKIDLNTGEVLASVEADVRAPLVYSLAHCSEFVYVPFFKERIDKWQIYKLRMDDLSFVDKLSFKKGKTIQIFFDYAVGSDGSKLYLLKAYLSNDDEPIEKYHVQIYETSGFKLVNEIELDYKANYLKLSFDGLLFVYPRHGKNGAIKIYNTNDGKLVSEIKFPETESIYWLDASSPDGKIFFLTNVCTKGKGYDPTLAKIYEFDPMDSSTVIYPVNATLKAYETKPSIFFKVDLFILPTMVFKKEDRIRVCFVESITISRLFGPRSNKDTIHYYDVELN